MSPGASRHSSPISRSSIAILRALGVGPPYRVIIALSFPPEPALQHIACVLPDRQRGGAADAAGRRRQLGEDALHPDSAELGILDRDQRLARGEMRVGDRKSVV